MLMLIGATKVDRVVAALAGIMQPHAAAATAANSNALQQSVAQARHPMAVRIVVGALLHVLSPLDQELKSPNRDGPIMYYITLRNKFETTIIGWYDGSASNFSTDQRRAKLFSDRVDADLVAYQLRRMYPRIGQDIEVTPAARPTAMIYNCDRHNGVVVV
jgi:hypothetical protein